MSDNVIPLRPQRTSDRLEALARKPFAFRRGSCWSSLSGSAPSRASKTNTFSLT
jgi:hypothetical protein